MYNQRCRQAVDTNEGRRQMAKTNVTVKLNDQITDKLTAVSESLSSTITIDLTECTADQLAVLFHIARDDRAALRIGHALNHLVGNVEGDKMIDSVSKDLR